MGQWRCLAKEALDRTLLIAKFLGFLHVTNTYICSSTLVYGPSMLPTLNLTGDVLLAEHFSHRFGKVGCGDLVLVRSPQDPRKTVTKRVLGMEGDRITFFVEPNISERSRTILNCRNLNFKLASRRRSLISALQASLVPKGHVWIQGDNIYASNDSRHFGPVPYGLVQGKVFFRVWPPDSFGYVE